MSTLSVYFVCNGLDCNNRTTQVEKTVLDFDHLMIIQHLYCPYCRRRFTVDFVEMIGRAVAKSEGGQDGLADSQCDIGTGHATGLRAIRG